MENEVKNSYHKNQIKGIGLGIILMLIGVLFLGFNSGLLPMSLKWIIISWQMLLIVIGVSQYFKNKISSGTILILIGVFFLLPKIISIYPDLLPRFNGDFTQVYWPLLLIVGGIIIIFSRVFGSKGDSNSWNSDNVHQQNHHHYNKYTKDNTTQHDGFSKNCVFAKGDHIVLDPEFKGGELNAVFGAITLDLRRTNLTLGETRLDVNAVFGGITIYVPADWCIETHVDAIFGGFQDNRIPSDALDKTKKLIITGSCVFGGGELRN